MRKLKKAIKEGDAKPFKKISRSVKRETDSKGRTLVHLAAAYGRAKILSLLIWRHEHDVHVFDDDGNTPLHLAIIQGQCDCAIMLYASGRTNVRQKNRRKETPRHLLRDKAEDSAAFGVLHWMSYVIGNYRFEPKEDDSEEESMYPENEHTEMLRKVLAAEFVPPEDDRPTDESRYKKRFRALQEKMDEELSIRRELEEKNKKLKKKLKHEPNMQSMNILEQEKLEEELKAQIEELRNENESLIRKLKRRDQSVADLEMEHTKLKKRLDEEIEMRHDAAENKDDSPSTKEQKMKKQLKKMKQRVKDLNNFTEGVCDIAETNDLQSALQAMVNLKVQSKARPTETPSDDFMLVEEITKLLGVEKGDILENINSLMESKFPEMQHQVLKIPKKNAKRLNLPKRKKTNTKLLIQQLKQSSEM